jgi:hypothetical protein
MAFLTFGIEVGRFCVALQQITADACLRGIKQTDDIPAAALDIGNRAAEDRGMDATIDIVWQEMNAGFKEVNARIEDHRKELSIRIDDNRRELCARLDSLQKELFDRIQEQRREFTARIDAIRGEMLENFRVIDAKIEQVRASRRESMTSI